MTSTSSLSNNGLNTSGISVGADGKITVSGISSGIDTQALINAQLAADGVPITNLQSKITANNTLVSAYGGLKTKVSALTTALDALRNNLAFGSTNAFTTMTATGTTTAAATAPNGYTPSDVNTLITTSFSSKAQSANHTITIEQLATAEQDASDAQLGNNTDLNMSGTLTINGKSVTIATTDSLLDVRDKINAAGANVSATIVSSDATHSYLILSSSTTGSGASAITFTQTALSDSLGLTNGSAAPKNQKTQGQNAILDVDGISGITRSSNTISDVIDGVTLNLQKAEPDTVINLGVTPDLNGIKTAIGNFVTAYNDLRTFITTQNTSTSTTNPDGSTSSSFGPLYNDSILRGIADQLSFLTTATVPTNPDGFKSLSQIGVTMGSDYTLSVDDSAMDPKLLSNVGAIQSLFGFSASSSDSRVNVVDRGATASGTYYVNFSGTDANGNVTGGTISTTSGAGDTSDGSLTLLGNNVVDASSQTTANGLTLGFTNSTPNLGPIDGIQVTVTRGIADSFYDYFSQLTATGTGTIDTQVASIGDQTTNYQSQIDTLNDRLSTEKTNLTNKYAAMETALAQLASLKDEITAYFTPSTSSS